MNDSQFLDPAVITENLPPALTLLGAKALELQKSPPRAKMQFTVSRQFCHSEVIVQGGYLTAMLDATMAQTCFAAFGYEGVVALPTLEIKVSFISPGHPGTLVASAWAQHMGRSIAFLEAKLVQIEEGGERLVATATSTYKLILERGTS